MGILVTSKKFTNSDKNLAFKDLEEVHKIRGRILHFSSILEAILKDLVTRQIYTQYRSQISNQNRNYSKLDFSDRTELFILEVQTRFNNDKNFQKFKRNIKKLRQYYRNPWAHGFIYYQKYENDKKDSKYKPLNFIKNNKKRIPIHFKSKHFEIANKIFPEIFKWLKNNNFLKIKYYHLELN